MVCWNCWHIIKYSIKICTLCGVAGVTGTNLMCIKYSITQAKLKGVRTVPKQSLFGCKTKENIKIYLLFWQAWNSLIPLKNSKTCHITALWTQFIDIITASSYFAENLGRTCPRRGPTCQSTNAYVALSFLL